MRPASCVMLGALLVRAVTSTADSFESALEKARANEASPVWHAYAGSFFEQLGPALQRGMQRCFPASVNAAGTTFTIVFSVRADGTLTRMMVRPESPGATCVVKEIRAARVPAPPRPDWWAFIDMRVTP